KCTVQNPWPGQKVTVVRKGGKAETVSGPRFTLGTSPNEALELRPHPGP
ncbi:hypothetical protein HQ560_08820, partial [bacterium]|nr:hypothetical protein [bacterium]